MSNVIKAESAQDFEDACIFDLSDIEAKAAAVLAEAEASAAGIIAAARKEAEEIKARAEQEGRKAGLEEGKREGFRVGADEAREEVFDKAREEISNLTSTFTRACEEFCEVKENLFLQAQKDLLNLALLIAKKIVAREIEADAHVSVDNLKRCLDVLSSYKNLTVRVAPQVLETVQARMDDLAKRLGDLSSVKIEGDPSISPGGCEVIGERGSIDATIETQFAEVERVLFGEEHG